MSLPELKRRTLLQAGTVAACALAVPGRLGAQPVAPPPKTAEEWLEEALSTKGLGAPVRMTRFAEPIYVVLDPGITWTPNPDNGPQYKPVFVPQGFVTDLASIPPALFPVLRADGDYAQAAIVHDYLYWTQRISRDMADEVFKVAMRDLEVGTVVREGLYLAVHTFGQSAWDQNAALKRAGERRFLRNLPPLAKTRWAAWKLNRDNFHPQDL